MDASKIVVGYVMTPEGEAALEAAVEEARVHGAELIVVHSARGKAAEDVERVRAYEDALAEIDQRLTDEGIPHRVRDFIRDQTPAEDLVQTVEEEGADLIVIGLRARTPTGKYLLGSDAQDILLSAPCPVLGIKASRG